MQPQYHMIDYIHEIPSALEKTLKFNEPGVQALAKMVRERSIQRVVIVGLGSSYTAALMAAPLFLYHCALPVTILSASELEPYLPTLVDEKTLVISVSRSGERGWVVDALQAVAAKKGLGFAITGTPGSLLAQNAQHVLLTQEGKEITYAKTKSVTACAGLLMRIALELARPGDETAAARLAGLRALPAALERTIQAAEPQVQKLFPGMEKIKLILASGTLGNVAAAMEAAIKIQETDATPTIGFDTGNLLHGPWGPASPDLLAILLITTGDQQLSRKVLRLAGTLKCRRMAVIEPGVEVAADEAEHIIQLPVRCDPFLSAPLFLIPLQLLTYYWALAAGFDADSPHMLQAMLDAMLPPGRTEP